LSLLRHIVSRIRESGPISIADYMADCLLHPEFGYYSQRDPLGAKGDFTTAPEISQMFGELIGLALAQSWLDQNAPAPFLLAELGPGRGTLMADALRAAARVPGFLEAAQVWLVEASPALQTAQAATLEAHKVNWAASLAELPDLPLFLVANEFFDALPIRQFGRTQAGWRERRVGLDAAGALSFGYGPEGGEADLAHRLDDTRPGDLVELNRPAIAISGEIGARLARRGGAALIVDYGDWRALGDTFQALKNHAPVNPLDDPGSADLTAHVDFEALALAAAASGARYSRLTPQGVFLERLGITARARALAGNGDESLQNAVAAAHRRLTHPDEMGNLFKVIGLYPANAQSPPGVVP
jgi:SAM-dependent MidA family methyltransferase